MMISMLCESLRDRHPQEKCASTCVVSSVSLCLHQFFSTDRSNYGVAESDRRESLKLVYVGSSPTSVANHAVVAQLVDAHGREPCS